MGTPNCIGPVAGVQTAFGLLHLACCRSSNCIGPVAGAHNDKLCSSYYCTRGGRGKRGSFWGFGLRCLWLPAPAHVKTSSTCLICSDTALKCLPPISLPVWAGGRVQALLPADCVQGVCMVCSNEAAQGSWQTRLMITHLAGQFQVHLGRPKAWHHILRNEAQKSYHPPCHQAIRLLRAAKPPRTMSVLSESGVIGLSHGSTASPIIRRLGEKL